MIQSRMLVLLKLIVFCITIPTLGLSASKKAGCCSSCIECPTNGHCIRYTSLCDGIPDCEYGEDEDLARCRTFLDHNCEKSEVRCGGFCQSWGNACSRNSYCREWNYNSPYRSFCHEVRNKKLNASEIITTEAVPEIDLEQLSTYLSAANCSMKNSSSGPCPLLYNDVSGLCVSFLPFQVTWPEARQVCRSIGGTLVEFDDVDIFVSVVQHITSSGLTSDYWTGGHFDIKHEAWVWKNGTEMPSSTPFWVLRYDSRCAPRTSEAFGEVPGCYHYQQAPASGEPGYCAAMQYKYMYYLSDESCYDKKNPICVYP